jgi:hypothetical protein
MVIVIVSKCKSRWHEQLVQSFYSVFDKVHILYINELIQGHKIGKNGAELTDDLSRIIISYSATHILFDLEFSLLLSPWEVNEIGNICKIPTFGWGIDDDRFHDVNCRVYAGVDAMLTNSLSVERYRLIDKQAFNIFPFFELAPEAPNLSTSKEIDVLFFGLKKADRAKKILFLEERGINVYCADFSTTHEDLVQLIYKSKIVLNLSGGSRVVTTPLGFVPFIEYREDNFNVKQLKSRIFEAGGLGSLCVSEDFPLDSTIFPKESLPIGRSIEELYLIIEKLLKDEDYYKDSLEKFQNQFFERYNLKNRSIEFKKFLSLTSFRDSKKIIETPVLYSACILATKFIYQRSYRVFSPFKIKDKNTLIKKFVVISLSLIILIWSSFKLLANKIKNEKN